MYLIILYELSEYQLDTRYLVFLSIVIIMKFNQSITFSNQFLINYFIFSVSKLLAMSICHVLASDICLSATFTGKFDDSEDVSVSF